MANEVSKVKLNTVGLPVRYMTLKIEGIKTII